MREYAAPRWRSSPTSSRWSAGTSRRSGYDYAAEFVFGLDLILDALDKLRDEA